MEISQTRLILAAVVLVAAGFFAGKQAPGPTPTPAPPKGPDMVAVFAQGPDKARAREHAALFGDLCDRIADTLEADAKRGGDRRICSGIDMAVYRSDLRYCMTGGWSFSAGYPLLRPTVERWLDDQAGKSPKTLTDEDTRRWVEAFRGLGQSSKYASMRL